MNSRQARLALPGVLTAAHQALELGFGSGIIGQRHVGLAPAVALAVLADAGEVTLALDRPRWGRILAMAAGTAVAASALHFTLFPWRLRFGVPVLAEGEGLHDGRLAAYVVVLYAWGAAGAAAAFAIPPGRRRWTFAGVAAAAGFSPIGIRHTASTVTSCSQESPKSYS